MITYHDVLIDCNFDTLENKTKIIIVEDNIYCKIKKIFLLMISLLFLMCTHIFKKLRQDVHQLQNYK